MKNPRDIIIEPIITEKSARLSQEENKFVFKVIKDTNKVEVRKAIESIFNVKVAGVSIINVKPRKRTVGKHKGFKSAFKKAIIKLAEGNTIDFS